MREKTSPTSRPEASGVEAPTRPVVGAPTLEIEQELWGLGYRMVCGLDEAGRGALAGPLVAAAVILPGKTIENLNDSKLLGAKERCSLYEVIIESAHWGVGVAEVKEINRHGIQTATYLAFRRSLDELQVKPDFLLIDHYRLPAAPTAQKSVTFGDRLSQTIAAASIIAKVTRDQIMCELALTKEGRGYYLNQHFGYGTARHLKMIDQLGPSIHHRRQFIPHRQRTLWQSEGFNGSIPKSKAKKPKTRLRGTGRS